MSAPPLEIWGGVECTVNRVGDDYHHQLERSGHAARIDDLDLFAGLGIRALRYPVLWERTAPDGLERACFAWADERLSRIRALGIRPIVGLVHHGSGPRGTSLVDPAFAYGLARFAGAVAERYPWIDDWTPVNEPLTTARFSGLYGHWYPHGRDERTFVRALLTQCQAICLAMRAVRAINPRARLIQTEDLGYTRATPLLAYQAAHENHRRFLSLDLLAGRVDRDHPLHGHLLRWGAAPSELARFVEEPCPPDVLGLNYYLTSERVLDERVARYPLWSHGGNGQHAYADVEAVRVAGADLGGFHARLIELWQRYQRPVAITEVHLGGPREEQLRWLLEAFHAAEAARAEGADVRAVTAWALLGSFDWDSLVVRQRGYYESGLFDVRGAEPRATALAALARSLSRGERFDCPPLRLPGWWRREDRIFYPPIEDGARLTVPRSTDVAPAGAPILVTGATGALGKALARTAATRALPYRLIGRGEMDIADPGSVGRALDRHSPWAVINTAGYGSVDHAEGDAFRCARVNTLGPAVLARACRDRDVRLVTFSSDLVFDGGKTTPYLEGDPTAPLSVYGESQALAEREVLAILQTALVVRTAALFSPWDDGHFIAMALRSLGEGRIHEAAEDVVISPTYLPDLAHAVLDLLIDGERGIWHITNEGAVSWAGLAERSAELAGVPLAGLLRRPARTLGQVARRPRYSALASERSNLLPPLDDALGRYLRERAARRGGE